MPSTSSEQFEDMLLEQLKLYKSGSAVTPDGRRGSACERLVVFVDDLDRLSAEEMVAGLDAVRTFMEIPKSRLPAGLGLVFVISCDEAKVADALAKGRRNADLPATVFNHSDARRYLDRIFQFRIEIPPPPRQDMRAFAKRHLKQLPGIAEDLSRRGIALEPIVDRMIHVGVKDPRNALQIVNAFGQAWWLATKRELEPAGRSGGLHEGAVTEHPVSLGALCALKVSFPDFYHDLQLDPGFLQSFTDVVVRGQTIEEQPLSARQLLEEQYLANEEGASPNDVKPAHRPLRQYVASLYGLRWPESLQSLLLLSEDPISRRLGARGAAVYDAFVSGDARGVLEGMGRHNDAAPLHADDARMLLNMYERVDQESDSRQINAARAVAQLVERIPDPPAQQLLSALCRQLVDSLDLRSQLGPKRIIRLMNAASGREQMVVASKLVRDCLRVGKNFALRLETLETPSLDDVMATVRELVPAILQVRREWGLDPVAEVSLREWLLDRTLSVAGKSIQLPFGELEAWLDSTDHNLVEDLGVSYLEALVDELGSDTPSNFDVTVAAARVVRIVDLVMPNGVESRAEAWSLLSRFLALRSGEFADVALQLARSHAATAEVHGIAQFVLTLEQRLKQEDDSYGTVDHSEVLQTVTAIVETRAEDLDLDTLQKMSGLASYWIDDVDTVHAACRLIDLLRQSNAASTTDTLTAWSKKLLGSLPDACITYLAVNFVDLDSSSQEAIVTALAPIADNESLSKDVEERYELFVDGFKDPDAWGKTPLKPFLDRLLPNIAARYANPNNYLYRVFENTATILKFATPQVLGPTLQTLFSQAKGIPAHYPFLHAHMVGNWPMQGEQYPTYVPQSIFDDAHSFAMSYPSNVLAGMLRSMSDMVKRGIVPADQQPKIIAAACSTWSAKPLKAAESLVLNASGVSADQAAELIKPIDWSDEEQIAALTKTWQAIARAMPSAKRTETCRRLLALGTFGPAEAPDSGLEKWLDAQPDHGTEILVQLFPEEGLNDAYRLRLWRQVIEKASVLGVEFFLTTVPRVVALPSVEETVSAIFDERERISVVVASEDDRAELARRLMEMFTEAKTVTTTGRIADYAHELAGRGALQHFDPKELSASQYAMLEVRFKGARELRRLAGVVQQAAE